MVQGHIGLLVMGRIVDFGIGPDSEAVLLTERIVWQPTYLPEYHPRGDESASWRFMLRAELHE